MRVCDEDSMDLACIGFGKTVGAERGVCRNWESEISEIGEIVEGKGADLTARSGEVQTLRVRTRKLI